MGQCCIKLSEEQVKFFQDYGYLKIDKVVTEEELSWLRDIYDLIVKQASQLHRGTDCLDASLTPGFLWIHTPELSFPELKTCELFNNSRCFAAKLLGVSVSEIKASFRIFYKPALIGKETPWHQDEAYKSPRYRSHSLNVWTALDPILPESGCMSFIPGSHKGEVRFHRQIVDDPTGGLGLITDDVDPANAVSCPIPSGGATLHHCRTLHRSGPNYKLNQRRALVIVCEAPAMERNQPIHWSWQSWLDRSWYQIQ